MSYKWMLALGLIAGSACHRVEYQPLVCPAEPPTRSAIGWQPIPRNPLTVSGRVVSVDSVRAVRGAGVRLVEVGQERGTDANGAFRLEVPRTGQYTLVVRSVGYMAASTNVDISGDSGVTALVSLEQRPIRFDGGCGLAVPVKKPWWRW